MVANLNGPSSLHNNQNILLPEGDSAKSKPTGFTMLPVTGINVSVGQLRRKLLLSEYLSKRRAFEERVSRSIPYPGGRPVGCSFLQT